MASLIAPQPATGRRNVALWSEGSKVAVSSVPLRSVAINPKSLSVLNDGRKPGSPNGAGAAWISQAVDGMPQWAWVRFPGMQTIDSVVLSPGGKDRWPVDLVGEYSADGGVTFKPLFEIKGAKPTKDSLIKAEFPPA